MSEETIKVLEEMLLGVSVAEMTFKLPSGPITAEHRRIADAFIEEGFREIRDKDDIIDAMRYSL